MLTRHARAMSFAGRPEIRFDWEFAMFRDREDGARQLAARLKGRPFHQPLVLAIPRGGVVTGAVLARELDAELDVVLSRKLRAPGQPELALGAISENGKIYLTRHTRESLGLTKDDIAHEIDRQLDEIARRKKMFRAVRPQATIADRSVLVTDDGIATGSTMIAALQAVKTQSPREVIVAVPVASPDRLTEVSRWCDEVVCVDTPDVFWAVGQFYEDFQPVEDEQVVELLRAFAPSDSTVVAQPIIRSTRAKTRSNP
jgi:predicted phosphoribosyltransferase